MTYTSTAAVNKAPIKAKDLENQHTVTPELHQQKNRGWNLKKGAFALVCAATAGVTLREVATQHFNSTHHGHAGRMLVPDEGNSTFNNSTLGNSTLGNSTADNTTCPDGYYRFDKAATLKTAKVSGILGMGVFPSIGLIAIVEALLSKVDDDANTWTCPIIGGAIIGAITFSVGAAISFHQANTREDGTCIERISAP